MYFKQITTPGLGCYSYVIGCPQTGVMAVVDPRRDIEVYLEIAAENDMEITHIFDTHVHADHVSGAFDLRALTNAEICIHAGSPVEYKAHGVSDGDRYQFGNATITVLHTPGHTPNSISLLVCDLARSAEPQMILTGDLLFVGDIGRPDLPGAGVMDEQIANLYDSLYKKLGTLPDYLEVYPGHGEGSLCGQGMSAKPSTTLGFERLANPMLQFSDLASFKEVVLSHLPMRPQSFSGIIAANLKGGVSLPEADLSSYALTADQAEQAILEGALVADLRDALSFGTAHIPGSINVDFTGGPRLNWFGVAVPPGVPLLLVIPADSCFEELCRELRRIGYEDVKGWLAEGIRSWTDSGRETASIPYVAPSILRDRLSSANAPIVVDVRTPAEYKQAHIEGSINLTFDRLMLKDTEPPSKEEELVVVCLSGFRAGIAASMLKAEGHSKVSILTGGMVAWQKS